MPKSLPARVLAVLLALSPLARAVEPCFVPRTPLLATASRDNTVRLWNSADGSLRVTLRTLPGEKSADWIAVTPEGIYDGSPGVASFIRWRVGDKLLPAAELEKNFTTRIK